MFVDSVPTCAFLGLHTSHVTHEEHSCLCTRIVSLTKPICKGGICCLELHDVERLAAILVPAHLLSTLVMFRILMPQYTLQGHAVAGAEVGAGVGAERKLGAGMHMTPETDQGLGTDPGNAT